MAARPMPRVVVITGGSAGVGRAIAREFAARGADVGLIARGRERLEAAGEEIRRAGRRASIYAADVADADALEAAAGHFENELGPIDCWVNNAMTTVFAPITKVRPEEFRRVTEVTYLGFVYGTQAALRRMLPRDRGVIVQVGSALAFRGIPLQAAYCGAKHAIQGFTESLRTELQHDGSGVRVTSVHLPAMNTPQFEWVLSRLPNRAQPVPPIYEPEVAARAVVWASTHDRRDLLVGFSTSKAVWGNRIAPGVADRYLAEHGYDAQQTDEPEADDRPSNLWEPVPGDYGAHGRFAERTRSWSPWTRASEHRAAIGGTVGVLALAAAAGYLVASRR